MRLLWIGYNHAVLFIVCELQGAATETVPGALLFSKALTTADMCA